MLQAGLENYIAAQTEKLTDEHKAARLQWCLQRQNLPEEVWLNAVVSDEKVVCSTTDAQRLVYRPRNTRYDPDYVVANKHSGRFSVGFWCWASGIGIGGIHYVDRRMDSVLYCDILQHRFLPELRARYAVGPVDFIQV